MDLVVFLPMFIAGLGCGFYLRDWLLKREASQYRGNLYPSSAIAPASQSPDCARKMVTPELGLPTSGQNAAIALRSLDLEAERPSRVAPELKLPTFSQNTAAPPRSVEPDVTTRKIPAAQSKLPTYAQKPAALSPLADKGLDRMNDELRALLELLPNSGRKP
jgi:hypothetical protein